MPRRPESMVLSLGTMRLDDTLLSTIRRLIPNVDGDEFLEQERGESVMPLIRLPRDEGSWLEDRRREVLRNKRSTEPLPKQHIAAYCEKCGSIQWVVYKDTTEQVKVPPCKYCTEGAREDGYQAGYDDGFAYGQDAKEKA